MRAKAIGLAAMALTAMPLAAWADDPRELVTMPPEIRESMLMNMQDHLVALDTVVSHIASERFTEAALIADQRLRFSNIEGEEAITDWFPPAMIEAKDALRAAATRFAVAARKADQTRDYASMRNVVWAISDITAACSGCHGHYRVR
ncbi:hypothetical protein [Magnetospirillum molischianum]|uniref:Cytochrome c n=1 Tax=Magnetospirillum molischianum DSM 120 TaxID=1150626 RepID=H8FNP6_MAGML|nr:hypothetical protein [Magnetospirillum molischianum]CCG39984.1 conserved exported hypothetical protein [Magnetospirillum molischianum DSM 120]